MSTPTKAVHSADNTRRLRTAVRDTKPADNTELPMCWNSWGRMDSLMVDVSLEKIRHVGVVEAGIERTIVPDSSSSFRSRGHVLNRHSSHDPLPIAAVVDSDPASCSLAVQTLHTQRCNTAAQDATATPFPVASFYSILQPYPTLPLALPRLPAGQHTPAWHSCPTVVLLGP
jgi:hypothetical protein